MFCMKFLIHYAYSDMKLHMRCSNENHLSRLYDLWVCACKRYYLKTCIPGHAPELPTHPDGPNSTKGVLNSQRVSLGGNFETLLSPVSLEVIEVLVFFGS